MAELDAEDKAMFLEELGVTDPDSTGLNALVRPPSSIALAAARTFICDHTHLPSSPTPPSFS